MTAKSLKLNDPVKITTGTWEGKAGRYIGKQGGSYQITLDGHRKPIWFSAEQFERTEEKP